MNYHRIVAMAVVALPVAAALAVTVGPTEGLAAQAFSVAPNVRVYRGIEKHPNYRPSGRAGIRVFRGQPNDPPTAPAAARADVTNSGSSRTLVPWNHFLAAIGARRPYPYWPAWRRTNILTHCAPRWMC